MKKGITYIVKSSLFRRSSNIENCSKSNKNNGRIENSTLIIWQLLCQKICKNTCFYFKLKDIQIIVHFSEFYQIYTKNYFEIGAILMHNIRNKNTEFPKIKNKTCRIF